VYALHLPPRHLWKAALLALALALAFVIASEWLAQVDFSFSGGGSAASAPVQVAAPPATWATDPMAPPTLLLND